VEPPPLLLPPQPTPAAKNTSSISPRPATRRRLRAGTPRRIPANNVALLETSQPKPWPDQCDVNPPDRLWAAVVLTVSIEVPEAFGTGFKLKAQVGAGLPPPVTLQVSATAPVKPPVGATVIVEVADAPAETVAGDSAGAAIVKLGDDTVRLTEVLWLVAPEVPVTVTLEVPAGVFEFVLIVRVTVPEVVTELWGENAQLAPTGRLAARQLKVTVPVNPFVIDTVIVDVPDCPGAKTVAGLPPIEKSPAVTKPGHEVTRTLASTDPRPVTRS
jgi:hypothetical protein